jgi:DNA repair photolyase
MIAEERGRKLPLNKSTGNMYPFVDYTYNPMKGFCPYNCSYCYTHRWGSQKPLHLDEKELRVDLGSGNSIFVCSGCDLFHPDVKEADYARIIAHIRQFQENRYLLHTKNPARVLELAHKGYSWPGGSTVCVTVETNRWYSDMGNAPDPKKRLIDLSHIGDERMITIEPIMDFDITEFAGALAACWPLKQVNIGADSGRNQLKEPSEEKLRLLIDWLQTHTTVYLKKNLRRLLPEHKFYKQGARY